jgi:hypothetical protein
MSSLYTIVAAGGAGDIAVTGTAVEHFAGTATMRPHITMSLIPTTTDTGRRSASPSAAVATSMVVAITAVYISIVADAEVMVAGSSKFPAPISRGDCHRTGRRPCVFLTKRVRVIDLNSDLERAKDNREPCSGIVSVRRIPRNHHHKSSVPG